jgi:ankyrin repeat protein
MLLEAGVDVNTAPAEHKGRTALEWAAREGRLDIVQLLPNVGVDSQHPRDKRYVTAIELATR